MCTKSIQDFDYNKLRKGTLINVAVKETFKIDDEDEEGKEQQAMMK